METSSPRERKLRKLKTVKKKIKRLKSESKQLFKHPYSNRVGERANIKRQFYQAKVCIKEERVTSTTGTEICSVENSHPTRVQRITFQLHMMLVRQWTSN